MKTNRPLRIEFPDFTRAFYEVPEGTPVAKIEQGEHTPEGWLPSFIVSNPRAVGVTCYHDLKYHYMRVPSDAVTE